MLEQKQTVKRAEPPGVQIGWLVRFPAAGQGRANWTCFCHVSVNEQDTLYLYTVSVTLGHTCFSHLGSSFKGSIQRKDSGHAERTLCSGVSGLKRRQRSEENTRSWDQVTTMNTPHLLCSRIWTCRACSHSGLRFDRLKRSWSLWYRIMMVDGITKIAVSLATALSDVSALDLMPS